MKQFLGLCLVVAAFVASGSARAEGYSPNYASPQYGMQSGYSHGMPMNNFIQQPYGQQSYGQSYPQQYPSQYQNQGYRQCRNQQTGMPQQCRRPRRRAQQGCGMQGGCGQQGMGGMGFDPYNSYAGYGGGYGGQGMGGGYSSGFSLNMSFGGGGGGGCNIF